MVSVGSDINAEAMLARPFPRMMSLRVMVLSTTCVL